MAKRGAKPPSLNDEKIKNLLGALNTGHYMNRACSIANVAPSTVYWWLDEAKKIQARLEDDQDISVRDEAYLAVAEKINQAKEAAAHRALHTIQLAASAGTWQAAAWYLERTDAEHYARRTQITGAESGPVKVDVSVDDVTALLKRILDEDDDIRE
jgi:hypothetical protein